MDNLLVLPYSRHRFRVGGLVVLQGDLPKKIWRVTWRGLLEVKGKRRPVYLVDNRYWDVYYEDELMPFGRAE